MKIKSKILIIAGSDSSGGAGIQADIKTATSLGVYSMTAVTAVTVQNTKGVKSVIPVPPNEIYNQIIHTIKDIRPNAIKIGMLSSNYNTIISKPMAINALEPIIFAFTNREVQFVKPKNALEKTLLDAFLSPKST